MRSLHDLYDSIEITDDVTLFGLFADCEPTRFEEVVQDKKMEKCYGYRDQGIKKNETWELATILTGKKKIGVKWVYKLKKNAKGEVEIQSKIGGERL